MCKITDYISEEWRNLSFIGYANYDVSTFGRVRNNVRDRIVEQNPNRNGVMHVGLYSEGIRRNSGVARLVAQAFLEIPDDPIFDTVTHRDGDLCNNRVENLEWRPRWFAIKYQQEYKDPIFYTNRHVIEETTGLKFRVGRDAASYFCLLEEDIHRACQKGIPPTIGTDLIFRYED